MRKVSGTVLDASQAMDLAESWAAAFNARDLNAIMDHYAEDVEVTSPVLVRMTGDPSGTLRGKAALRDYFERGLALVPGLHFEIRDVLRGVDGMTIYYQNQAGLRVVEVMQLDPRLKVKRYSSHYSD